jgi:hypothetical protein
MTLDNLEEKVHELYFKNNQWLNLETTYEDDGKLTEQTICLIKPGANHCTFCIYLRTFSDMESGWESKPYLIYEPEYRTFVVTVPKFGYITPEDIKKAIKYILRENVWLIFNIKLDGKNLETVIEEWRISKAARWTINFTKEKQNDKRTDG